MDLKDRHCLLNPNISQSHTGSHILHVNILSRKQTWTNRPCTGTTSEHDCAACSHPMQACKHQNSPISVSVLDTAEYWIAVLPTNQMQEMQENGLYMTTTWYDQLDQMPENCRSLGAGLLPCRCLMSRYSLLKRSSKNDQSATDLV